MKKNKNKIRCGRCGHPGIDMIQNITLDGRPKYRCQKCDYNWTQGNPYKVI